MEQELIKRTLSSILLIPMALFFIIKGSFLFSCFILFCFLVAMYEWHMLIKKKNYYFFGIIFLVLSFYSIYKLRNEFNGDYICLLFLTLICVSTDIGGYIFGKIFKGPKLTVISPKKTFSGSVGAYLLSIISIFIFTKISFINLSFEFTINIFIFVIFVSTISQLGDILISYFKRISNIKDTSNLIPGHGGLLDRIDGMIFAYPFSYLVLSFNFFNFF